MLNTSKLRKTNYLKVYEEMCETKKIDSIQTPILAHDLKENKDICVVQVFVKRSDGELFNFYIKFDDWSIAKEVRDFISNIELIRTCECKNQFRCEKHK